MKINRGQSALEFVLLVGVVMFFFLMFMFAVQERGAEKAYEERNFIVRDVALSVQNELYLAVAASEGYERTFKLPVSIVNQPYNVSIFGTLLQVNTLDGKHSLAVPIPNVNGTIVVGENKVRKQNNSVYVND